MQLVEEQIEAVARAMCAADGRDPDELAAPLEDPDIAIAMGDADDGSYSVMRWRQYVALARRYCAAHLALTT